MAPLTNVQKNIAVGMQSLAESILSIKNELAIAVAMYQAENMTALLDEDLQALPDFAHVSVQELTAARNALDAINIAMGEYVAGTNTTKLMRIINKIPQ